MLPFAVGLIAGILASGKDFPAVTLGAIAFVAALVAVVAAWRRATRRGERISPAVRIAAFAAAGVVVGAVAGTRHYQTFPENHVRSRLGDERRVAVVEGVIVDEPAFRAVQYLKWTTFRLEVEAVTIDGERRAASGRVACRLWSDEEPATARYGQRLRLSGHLARPEMPSNPGEIDRRAAYANERIHAILTVERNGLCEVLSETAGSPVVAAALRLKARLREGLYAAAPGDAAPFLDSILLGTRATIDGPVLDTFVRTGTIHALAISGQHLTLLAAMLGAVLTYVLRAPPRVTIAVVLGFVVVYCLAVTAGGASGSSPSIFRATIMIAIYSIGRLVSREPRTLNSLAIAAVVVLCLDPGDLMNVGFQLSFAAILGLELLFVPMRASFVGLFPPLGPGASRGRRISFRAAWLGGDLVLASLAAWLATTPLILWHFHVVTPGAVAANVVVVVPVWLVLNAGMAVMIIAPLGPALAKPFAVVAGVASSALVAIVERLAAIPGMYFYLPDIHGGQVAVAYAALGALAWAGARGFRPRWVAALAPVAAAVALIPPAGPAIPAGEARLAVLSVGKGLTAVVRTSEATVLFDCGAGRIVDPGTRYVAPYLWSRGVRSIDAIFLSHAHDDHVNALQAVVDRFRVGRVYVNPEFGDAPGGRRILAMLRARGIPAVALPAGAAVAPIGGVRVAVLAPRDEGAASAPVWGLGAGGSGGSQRRRYRSDDDRPPGSGPLVPAVEKDRQNDASLVLAVEAGGHRLLLPGDLEEAGSEAILASGADLGADILLVPHHGSANRHAAELASRVRPRIAIASTKTHFASAEVLCTYEDFGAAVLETWATGCLELALRPGGLAVQAFAGGLPPIPAARPTERDLPLVATRTAAPRARAPVLGTDEERPPPRRAPVLGTDETKIAPPRVRSPVMGTDEAMLERARRMRAERAAVDDFRIACAGDTIALAASLARAAVIKAPRASAATDR